MANLIRFNHLNNHFDDFHTLFQQLQHNFFNQLSNTSLIEKEKKFSYPKVDVIDEKNMLVIEASVPGLEKENVVINYSSGVLSLRGESRNSNEKNNNNYMWRELHKSSFYREFHISEKEYDLNAIDASLKNGILTIKIPKLESNKQALKPIEIKVIN